MHKSIDKYHVYRATHLTVKLTGKISIILLVILLASLLLFYGLIFAFVQGAYLLWPMIFREMTFVNLAVCSLIAIGGIHLLLRLIRHLMRLYLF